MMLRSTEGAEPTLLHEFFTRAAARWPHHVAIDVPPGALRPERHRLTYQELDRLSDAIAHRLASAVTGECVVAILLPRSSPHVYAAQLGTLKAGAAYTCCDTAFPDDRLRDTIADAQAVAVLTDAAGRTRALAAGTPPSRVIDVVEYLRGKHTAEPFTPPAWITPGHLAYVIYTSGTTGRPKGVMIEHRSIVNLVASDRDLFGIAAGDRCVQCSSPAYDSSVEEAWMAFAVGATLVVMDEHDVRLGPDIVPWLRRERIAVFCPPPTLLRASGCTDPAKDLPDLKLLYVGGEALPQDLSDRWAAACTLVNGYGPTECTVTTVRTAMRPGHAVTIGAPIPNVQAWIVDEDLDVVADGDHGELLLGGIALSRGYWNQPELTAERFPQHPVLGRVYRTGDVAHRDAEGNVHYHGRSDAQVKLRGYRVELGAIESALASCRGVRAAACTVQGDGGRQTLVAFVVLHDGVEPPATATLSDTLRATLPEYMVPVHIGVIDQIPTSISGKLDRKALPRFEAVRGNGANGNGANGNGTHPEQVEHHPPLDPVEARIVGAMRQALERSEPIGRLDDFFTHLGGDSLSAAILITTLREHAETGALDVRDVYEARTVAALAERARGATRAAVEADEAPQPAPVTWTMPKVIGATVTQALWLLRRLVMSSVVAWFVAFKLFPFLVETLGLTQLLLLAAPIAVLVIALYAPLSVAMAVLTKRMVIGRYTAGRFDAWSSTHVRNWMVQQMVKSIPWWLLEGTEFQLMALRALGAKIGKRVHIHRGVDLRHGGWDLLDIGDDVSLGQNASLRLVELEQGQIVFAPITLGDRVTLEVHAGVGGHTVIEPDGYLGAGSSLPRGGRIPRGERWDGIPAHPAGTSPSPPPLPANARPQSPLAAAFTMFGARLALTAFIALPVVVAAIGIASWQEMDAQSFLDWLYTDSSDAEIIVSAMVLSIVSIPPALVMEALACRLMGRVDDGVVGRWTPAYVRVWLKPFLLDSAGRWLYGTLFWPTWLRLAGMKVGTGCEISGLIDTVPELVSIGDKTFCADGIYLAGPVIHRGTVSVARTSIGSNCFFGNGAIIAAGTHIPDDVLLGVCTVAAQDLRPASAWFGHPPFELPHREVVTFDAAYTWDPSAFRYAARVFWELARFVVPAVPAMVAALWFNWLAGESTLSTPALILFAVPATTLVAGIVVTFLIIGIKWALLGKVKPSVHPLWSSWASRWDLMCLAWNIFAADIVAALDGTLMLNALLRLMGVRIGRGVLLGSDFAEDLPDPDMLTFEDGATIDCLFQAHTFEDRVLKMDRVTIRRGASVGRNAVLLYGSEVGENTRVAPHSVVMKQEHLRPNRTYAGFPTRPVDRADW